LIKFYILSKYDQTSVADPRSGAFLIPGSGIRNSFYPDSGSESHIFENRKV